MNSNHKCLLKVVGHPRGNAVKQRMTEMLDDPECCDINTDDSMVFSEADIHELYLLWKARFKRSGRNPRHTEHIVLSAKTGSSSLELFQLTSAVLDFVEENFSSYHYFFAVKKSAPYPTVKLLIHSQNQITGKQLHMPFGWANTMRQAWADALNKNGIPAEA